MSIANYFGYSENEAFAVNDALSENGQSMMYKHICEKCYRLFMTLRNTVSLLPVGEMNCQCPWCGNNIHKSSFSATVRQND